MSFVASGTHTLRIQTREDGVQLDEVVLSPSAYLSSSPGQVVDDNTKVLKPGTTGTSTPFSGTAMAIPGTVPAANFDNGGEGVAYHDLTSGNAGGAFRATDVDLEPASVGGYDVGWVSAGEWLNYSVNVAAAGSYTMTFRVASLGQGGTFHLMMNGTDVTGRLTIPDTQGWQNWQTVSATVTLDAGAQAARLVMDSSGVNAVGNFQSMAFASTGSVVGGSIINVPAGGNLQAAIDSAQPGATIALAAGAVFAGSFVLPAKPTHHDSIGGAIQCCPRTREVGPQCAALAKGRGFAGLLCVTQRPARITIGCSSWSWSTPTRKTTSSRSET